MSAAPIGVAAAQSAGPLTLRGGRFTVVAYPSEQRLARSLLDYAVEQDSFPGLRRPTQPTTILIAPDRATFRQWIGPHAPEWGSAVAFPGEGKIVLQGRSAGSDAGDPARTLRHELAHLALWEVLGDRTPRWFDEGYASWAAGEWGREEVLTTSVALVVRGAPSVDELESWFAQGPTRARNAYALSHRAVAEMAALDGERGLALFFRYWEESGSIDAALRRAYGLTLEGFDRYWGRRTQLRYGALAVVGNLSLALALIGVLVLPLFLVRRQRDKRRLEALRAEDAVAERRRHLEEAQLEAPAESELDRNRRATDRFSTSFPSAPRSTGRDG